MNKESTRACPVERQDDGKKADKRLIDIFNKNGIKGTFHLNSGLMKDDDNRIQPEEIKTLYAGHEVAAHNLTHPTIERCPREQIVQEIIEDRKNLEEIVEYTVRGLSYPNGSYNKDIKEILPHLGIEYSRIVGNSENFSLPGDLFAWEATCHHNYKLMDFAREFADLYKTQYLYMMYVWGHSYEFDNDDNWNLMEEFGEYIGGRDDIWYATNIEIVDYLKVLDNLKFSAAGNFVYNPSALSAWVNIEGDIIKINGGESRCLL